MKTGKCDSLEVRKLVGGTEVGVETGVKTKNLEIHTLPPVTEKFANIQYFSFLCPVYVFRHWGERKGYS